MDEEIAGLRDLVQKNIALTEDTNRMVHKMRRAQKWGSFFKLVWWILIIAVSGATYYLYLQPYVGKLETLYDQVQGTTHQTQSWNTQIQNFFKSIAPPKNTSATTPTSQ